jgi:hypothetical protein
LLDQECSICKERPNGTSFPSSPSFFSVFVFRRSGCAQHFFYAVLISDPCLPAVLLLLVNLLGMSGTASKGLRERMHGRNMLRSSRRYTCPLARYPSGHKLKLTTFVCRSPRFSRRQITQWPKMPLPRWKLLLERERCHLCGSWKREEVWAQLLVLYCCCCCCRRHLLVVFV